MRGRLDEHYRVHNDKLVRKRMLDQQQYRYSDDAEERDVQVEDQRGRQEVWCNSCGDDLDDQWG